MNYLLTLLMLVFCNFSIAQNIDSLRRVIQDGKTYKTKVAAVYKLINYYNSTNPDSLIYFSNFLLNLATEKADSTNIAYAYTAVGNSHLTKGKISEAIENYQFALNYCDTIKNFKQKNKLNALVALCMIGQEIYTVDFRNKIRSLIAINQKEKDTAAWVFNLTNLAQSFDKTNASYHDSIESTLKLAMELCQYPFESVDFYYNRCILIYAAFEAEKKSFRNYTLYKSLDSLYNLSKNTGQSNIQMYALYFSAIIKIQNRDTSNFSGILQELYDLTNNENLAEGVVKKQYYEVKYKYEWLIKNYDSALVDIENYNNAVNDYWHDQNVTKTNNLKAVYDLNLEKSRNEIAMEKKERQQSKLFIAMLLMGFSSLSIFAYLIFRNFQKNQKLKLWKNENEMKTLRNSLNPHFLQNSFNLLYYNLSNEPEKLKENQNYVRELSTYFKKILKSNQTETHSVEEEIVLTESYIKLQQHLYSNKVNYSIEIDPDFDTIGIFVPNMLLQPFVENCFKHGFQPDNESPEIALKFYMENETPFIAIMDNGAGIQKEIKEGDGTRISRRKLNLVHNSKSYNNILISNRKDGLKGTQVLIKLPKHL